MKKTTQQCCLDWLLQDPQTLRFDIHHVYGTVHYLPTIGHWDWCWYRLVVICMTSNIILFLFTEEGPSKCQAVVPIFRDALLSKEWFLCDSKRLERDFANPCGDWHVDILNETRQTPTLICHVCSTPYCFIVSETAPEPRNGLHGPHKWFLSAEKK